ncbi:MAG: 5'-3' exonuclease [Candidatus Nanopelagicales bacterium]|nr:5'-3' exonuclease [Candidatus Nanopelagicales bacterium]
MLLDTAMLYYRAFYSLPDTMTAPDGSPHNAIRGFFGTVNRLVEQYQPSGLAACWDVSWRPQWRVDLLASYKTHRLVVDDAGQSSGAAEMPDTLSPQISAIAEILDAMGVARPGAKDHEADDVIASLATSVKAPVIVVSGDRDLVQLVDDKVHLLMTINGGMELWPLLTPAGVVERFGVHPTQYVDFATLRGDPSDGLPGVPGIGAKTAAALIQKYGSIDELLLAVDREEIEKPLTPRFAGLIRENLDQIHATRKVATAVRGLHFAADLSIPKKPKDPAKLQELANTWGVERYLRIGSLKL